MQLNRHLGLLTLFLAIGVSLPIRADVKVGDAFPDFASCKIEGELSAVPKDKVVLVDFWASWCLPCVQSFPAMEELQKTYGPRGFVVIAVNVDEHKSDMDDFLSKRHVSFKVVRDAHQKLVEKAGVATMPSSFLLDKNGRVAYVHSGFHGAATRKEYAHEIESLLGSK